MAHSLNIRNAKRDNTGESSVIHCGVCRGIGEHSHRCPMVMPVIGSQPGAYDLPPAGTNCRRVQRIEDTVMSQYYSGNKSRNCRPHLTGIPTGDMGLSVSDATGHIRMRPVTGIRCIGDGAVANLNQAYMCSSTDQFGDQVGWDASFEHL